MAVYMALLDLPLLASIAVIVLPLLLISVALVVLTGRRPSDVRANDNVATSAIRIVGGAFIFVTAFSTAAIWQESNHVAQTIGTEFGHARVIVNQLVAQQAPGTAEVVAELRSYAKVVREKELLPLQPLSGDDGADLHIQRVVERIVTLDDAQQLNSDDVKVLLDTVASMTTARSERLSQPYPVLPLPIFGLVLTLGLLTVVTAAVYPSGPDRGLKWFQALGTYAVVCVLIATMVLLLNGESGWLLDLRVGPADAFLAQTSMDPAR